MPSTALRDAWTPERLTAAVDDYVGFHRSPELSGGEERTAARIRERLTRLGLEVHEVGRHGVVGVLRNGDGPVVAYRADTDGLPVREDTGLPYASTETAELDGAEVPVMHACGHDAHIAVALALAGLLSAERETWSGTVVWIFQPAEETAAGAAGMVAAGLWDLVPRPIAVLGQHITAIPAGRVSIGFGDIMNLGDSWRVTIRGRGAHGAKPQESIDPIVIAAHTIVRLQTVVSREVDPSHPAVVTVGQVHAGTKENVIPDEAVIALNVRTPDAAVRERVVAAVRRIVDAEAAAGGAPAPVFERISRFPRCYNDPQRAEIAAAALEAEFGSASVDRSLRATGSEDVGALADAIGVPLVFWMFGAYRPGRESMPANHSPHFGPDAEEAVETGVRAGLAVLERFLIGPAEG